jgi:hypothetical protein
MPHKRCPAVDEEEDDPLCTDAISRQNGMDSNTMHKIQRKGNGEKIQKMIEND